MKFGLSEDSKNDRTRASAARWPLAFASLAHGVLLIVVVLLGRRTFVSDDASDPHPPPVPMTFIALPPAMPVDVERTASKNEPSSKIPNTPRDEAPGSASPSPTRDDLSSLALPGIGSLAEPTARGAQPGAAFSLGGIAAAKLRSDPAPPGALPTVEFDSVQTARPIDRFTPPWPVPQSLCGFPLRADFDIDQQGRVKAVQMVPSPDRSYDRRVRDYLRGWRFETGPNHNRPVRWTYHLEVTFIRVAGLDVPDCRVKRP